jgi:hypothetical protein
MCKNGRMVCACQRLVYGSPDIPAPQQLGLEDRKKEDGAGQCMTGETESDGHGEEGNCQDEDPAEAEGGGSDKWKEAQR